LRYLRWGGDGEAVQPEKGSGVEKSLKTVRIPSVGCTLCWAPYLLELIRHFL